MKDSFNKTSVKKKSWEIENISISHNIVDYNSFGKSVSKNDTELVRLHFGLSGNYDFKYKQLNAEYSFTGHHNNLLYSDGFEIEVSNKSKRIETFGINFTTESFVNIAQNGTDPLKRFSEKILNKKSAILSENWRPNNFKIQSVITEIINSSYTNELKDLFLLSKSIELLVLQAELYDKKKENNFIRSNVDKQKLFEAKEILALKIERPPTIVELSKLVGLNEYKLKKGFKELFETTIFGYIHKTRMTLAKRLLLGTEKSAKEVAYETGYSSPQHFSNAF
ncbi:AraC family transcriptional regulator [Zunongwangia sp. F260]|uniref:AraC family transcriptional regulator n=1 Tax=Autumnicola lenta TaxID=3075593 RepID=A0ABU3CGW0_9FLAO|nr:AraC family transcriptional regulator [Zunongwangia sp. F260]MDT0645477.1 AraC family transcriptional regulator [Zunongwangia sp. F260]